MMRRDLLLGAGCVAAFAGAEALRPRELFSLMGERTLAQVVPRKFAGWTAEDAADLIVPKTPGSLASTLYSETISRRYLNADGGAPVMLLIAHGDSQSDLLQLHRPEVCYKSVGFEITALKPRDVALAPRVTLPSVEMTARSGGRIEDVLYWTRLGEYLPRSAGEQRTDRLKTAMQGFVADGVLVRASVVRPQADADFARLAAFAAAMTRAMAPADRASLIGTERARAIA